MKKILTTLFILSSLSIMAQPATLQPIEETHPINHWWKIISIAIALGLGIAAYMLIKKNPRKDAD